MDRYNLDKINKVSSDYIFKLCLKFKVNNSNDVDFIEDFMNKNPPNNYKFYKCNIDNSYLKNMLFDIEETARMFSDFLEESYVTFSKKDNSLIASVVTTNLAKRFREMVDKNKRFVLMSGTLHSNHVLKNIFGIEKFKIIEAETEQQGQIEVMRTGLEKDCKTRQIFSVAFCV